MGRQTIKAILFAGTIVLSSIANASITKIALLDSGYNPSLDVKLCDTGHFDATTGLFNVGVDNIGHGTIMAKTIAKYAKKANYCIIIIKVFDKKTTAVTRGLAYAYSINPNVVNLSLNGDEFDTHEHYWLKKLLETNSRIFTAVGNDKLDLDKECKSYPACYKDLKLDVIGTKGANVNTGKIITQYEAYCTFDTCGSSNATAIATGKYVHSLRKRH